MTTKGAAIVTRAAIGSALALPPPGAVCLIAVVGRSQHA